MESFKCASFSNIYFVLFSSSKGGNPPVGQTNHRPRRASLQLPPNLPGSSALLFERIAAAAGLQDSSLARPQLSSGTRGSALAFLQPRIVLDHLDSPCEASCSVVGSGTAKLGLAGPLCAGVTGVQTVAPGSCTIIGL